VFAIGESLSKHPLPVVVTRFVTRRKKTNIARQKTVEGKVEAVAVGELSE